MNSIRHGLCFAAMLACVAGSLSAQRFVRDINQESEPISSWLSQRFVTPSGNSEDNFPVVGGYAYFRANGPSGQEIYRTNGGPATRVTDVWPGDGGTVGDLFPGPNVLYFPAATGASGSELWSLDTSGNATQFAELGPGSASADIVHVLPALGRVFITTNQPGNTGTRELWVSDGTPSGTQRLLESTGTGIGSNLAEVVEYPGGGFVLFEAHDAANRGELWRSDGTVAGTFRVTNFSAGWLGNYIFGFRVLGNRVVFTASVVGDGIEYYVTDGTEAGTSRISDLGVPGGQPDTDTAEEFGGKLWVYDRPSQGLWFLDGTLAGTGELLTIGNVTTWESHAHLPSNRLYFAKDGELWATDGTVGGTAMVADINPNGASNPCHFESLGNRVLFCADDGTHGAELWLTDGTAAGTTMVADLNPTGSSNPAELTEVGGRLVFFADDGTHGRELWNTDGTSAGTLLQELHAFSTTKDSKPRFLVDCGGELFFVADDGVHGAELWTSDSSTGGTQLVRDIRPGPEGSRPLWLTATQGSLVFNANDGTHGEELWVHNPTRTGLVKDIRPGSSSSGPSSFTELDGVLYFVATDDAHGRELWRTDLTEAGTVMVTDIYPGPASANPSHLTICGDRIYFIAADATHGREIWSTDGTAAGTSLVIDLLPGPGFGASQWLTDVGGSLFFAGTEGSSIDGPYLTDGTAAGTIALTDVTAGLGGRPEHPIEIGGGLFAFEASSRTAGNEMFISDGTQAGTFPIDTWPGRESGEFTPLGVVGGRLCFGANDGVNGTEIWTTDGTLAGTSRLLEVVPGAAGTAFNSRPGVNTFVPTAMVGDRIYFRCHDAHGDELWVTDGTASGTMRAADIYTGTASSYPQDLTLSRGKLYFVAIDPAHGDELWVLDLPGASAAASHTPCGSDLPTLEATPPRIGQTWTLSGTGPSGIGAVMFVPPPTIPMNTIFPCYGLGSTAGAPTLELMAVNGPTFQFDIQLANDPGSEGNVLVLQSLWFDRTELQGSNLVIAGIGY